MDNNLNSDPSSRRLAGAVEAGASAFPAEVIKRSLLTMLFTDVVKSTEIIERLGDEAWCTLQMQHDAIVRARLASFGGREVANAGDGFFAVFDAPVWGICCAAAIRSALEALGMRIRCGLHTSECLIAGSQVSVLAVHVAARIAITAKPNETLVSRAVKELAAGAGVEFGNGRRHALPGLRDEHELFTVKNLMLDPPGSAHSEKGVYNEPDRRAAAV